ncbi:MAG: DUF2293 domain-containing protein, partial [Planctomycetia bacterium]|nr:DUF2293 domain-containing protein [Planctomycetia bacterium]
MTELQDRVARAAEAVLQREGAVGPLELLQQLSFLSFSHIQQWKTGNEHYTELESHIQCGEKRLNDSYRHFLEWVSRKKLEPIEVPYVRTSRFDSIPLQVTEDGDPEREQFFRTHFRRSDLSPAKQQRLEKKLSKPADLLVYQLTSPQSECGECGAEMFKGELLFLEKGEPLCLACADLDHLEFLPSGDTALTRRSRKYSSLAAIVLKFNRSRKRYERQGILAAPEA